MPVKVFLEKLKTYIISKVSINSVATCYIRKMFKISQDAFRDTKYINTP